MKKRQLITLTIILCVLSNLYAQRKDFKIEGKTFPYPSMYYLLHLSDMNLTNFKSTMQNIGLKNNGIDEWGQTVYSFDGGYANNTSYSIRKAPGRVMVQFMYLKNSVRSLLDDLVTELEPVYVKYDPSISSYMYGFVKDGYFYTFQIFRNNTIDQVVLWKEKK